MQRSRKTAAQHTRRKKTQQKIENYMDNAAKAEEQYSQTLEEYLHAYDIPTSFAQLHLYLDRSMLCQVKKQNYLDDGVYVLLEGSLTYVWTKNKHDRDRKEHLFALARLGSWSNLVEGTNQRENYLTYGYSLVVSGAFTVIEAQGGNFSTNEDCSFLRVPQRVLQLTDFQKLKAEKMEIIHQAKLPGARINPMDSLITVNFNLHMFKTRKLVFRNKIEVDTMGIITKGTAILKNNKGYKKIQLLKHCLMLPDFEYEVSSAQLQMLEIIRNPTLVIKKPILIKNFIQEYSTRLSSQQQNQQKSEVNKYSKKITNSISTHKARNNQNSCSYSSSKQEAKKKKQMSLFSKQNQDYWIVSMQLCKESMNNIRRFKKNHLLQSEQKSRLTKPRILFNLSKKKQRARESHHNDKNQQPCESQHKINQNRSECDMSSFYDINGSRTNNNFLNSKNSLMERYEIYAKDMFEEFKKYSSRKKETSLYQLNGGSGNGNGNARKCLRY